MKFFICINDLSKVKEEDYDPNKIIDNKALNQEILGIFFYSNSVSDLTSKSKSNIWLVFAKKRKIPIFACLNSIKSRNLTKRINPLVQITGLGQVIEGVISSEKTLVIGEI